MPRFLKGCLILLGGLVAVALIGGGGGYYLLTRPVPPPVSSGLPAAAPTPTPPPQVVEERAQSLENKLSAFQQQVDQAQQGTTPAPFRLEITEDEANAMVLRDLPKLNEQMKGSSLAVTSVQAAFRDGKLKAVSQGEMSGFKANLNMEGSIALEAGKPKLVVEKLDLGLLPLPGALKEQITALVQDMFGQVLQVNPNVTVQKVTVADGKLVLEGIISPAAK